MFLSKSNSFGDEAGLAHACVGRDAHHLAASLAHQHQPVRDTPQLSLTADHRQRIARLLQTEGSPVDRGQGDEGGDRPGLSLNPQRRQALPDGGAGGNLLHGAADQDLPGLCCLHQAGGHICLIAQHAVGATVVRAIGAGAHAPSADADLRRADGFACLGGRAQLESCGEGTNGIVLVCDRGAKRCIQVASLVADGQLHERAFESRQYALYPPHVAVQLAGYSLVVFEVKAFKSQKEGDGGT